MAQSESPQGKGTRAVLGSWLQTKKRMTYTKYSNLPTAEKVAIQKEYQGRGKESVREPGQSNRTQEGTPATI
jgi:hypothetical protein